MKPKKAKLWWEYGGDYCWHLMGDINFGVAGNGLCFKIDVAKAIAGRKIPELPKKKVRR